MSRLYIVDDHPLVRGGLRAVLERAGHEVVGEGDHPVQALADLKRLLPEILLLDLRLGERSGFEILEQMRARQLAVRAIVLTVYAQPACVMRALRSGAMGYLLKSATAAELLAAVGAVAQGRRHLGHEVAALGTFGLDGHARARSRAGQPDEETRAVAGLSARERQVVMLVVRGRTSAAIAQALHLSPKTVESYRSRLMTKLGVSDLPALVRLALRTGLVDADEA